MYMFMGLDAQMFWRVVASSSPVGGSGTLQPDIMTIDWMKSLKLDYIGIAKMIVVEGNIFRHK